MDKFLKKQSRPPTSAVAKRYREDDWRAHVEIVTDHGKGSYTVICHYCGKGSEDGKPWRTGGTRIKQHLQGMEGQGISVCQKIPETVRNVLKGISTGTSGRRQRALPSSGRAACQKIAEQSVARCIYYNGVAFNVVDSPAFREMCADIGSVGDTFVVPSRRQLSGKMLDHEYARVQEQVKPLIANGKDFGLTICSGWTDINRHPLVNVLVNTVDGPVFLDAENMEDQEKDAECLANILSKHIKKLRPENIVCVVTDNAAVCEAAGKLLENTFPHISWVGCAAHCIDLVMKDIFKLDWAAACAQNGRELASFMRKHQKTTALLRQHTLLELKLPAETRFAGKLSMLERIVQIKSALAKVVESDEYEKFVKKRCAFVHCICVYIVRALKFVEAARRPQLLY